MKALSRRKPAGSSRPAYSMVFILLAVFTVLEVAASYLSGPIKIPILIVLAVTKALLVLMFFMHLRYDLRVFSLPFIIAVVLVVPIGLVLLLVMPLL